jgi:hypothetical protein
VLQQPRRATLLQHEHIVETRWEIRGREGAWKRTLVVMTMLTLDPFSPDYDAATETELLKAIGEFWENNLDRMDAVNVRSAPRV